MSQILNIFTLMIKSEIRTNLESLLTDLPSYNGKPPSIIYSLPQMLLDIFFLSSLFPLTQELFQNPHLNYLFQTLNLTHTLLNASNQQLAKDC